jgi:hypothetical protein
MAELLTMWCHRAALGLADGPVRYPLPIGGTPLLPVPALRRELGMPDLWVKDETRGPTASNKDRATALVLEDGLRRGLDTITTASTGNAAVATAFGAAAAGLRAVIFVSTGCKPEKLALMTQAGAWVFRVRGRGRPVASRGAGVRLARPQHRCEPADPRGEEDRRAGGGRPARPAAGRDGGAGRRRADAGGA